MIRSVIRGVGAYLPARVVANDELCRTLDTSDAWIRERTGIRERRIAAEGELTSDLAAAAGRAALLRADLDPATIDLVLVATSTPDLTFPATATAVQRKLALKPGIAFDLQAVCAGFAYAVATADSYLKTGLARRALVIGAETFSRLLDWEDRSTAVLFGDGAGAVVLDAVQQPGTVADRGVLAAYLAADGGRHDDLYVDGGPSSTGTTGHLRMNGREVFRHAVVRLADAALQVLERADLPLSAVDLMVPHQANARIIDAVGRRLGIDPARVVVTVDRHANTSAASIPLALAEADAAGRLRPGSLVLMNALGGGFAWGAVLARW
jgi:3-oxoacyl-[acyl-carrier-protein] synthase III